MQVAIWCVPRDATTKGTSKSVLTLHSIIFQVLASYIGPFGKQCHSHEAELSQSSSEGSYSLSVALLDLLGESCLIPALSSYLRNDSGLLKYLSICYLKGSSVIVVV